MNTPQLPPEIINIIQRMAKTLARQHLFEDIRTTAEARLWKRIFHSNVLEQIKLRFNAQETPSE